MSDSVITDMKHNDNKSLSLSVGSVGKDPGTPERESFLRSPTPTKRRFGELKPEVSSTSGINHIGTDEPSVHFLRT